MDFSHVSVLLKETIGNLITDPNGIYVDGTLGTGTSDRDRSGCGRNCSSDQEAGAFQR